MLPLPKSWSNFALTHKKGKWRRLLDKKIDCDYISKSSKNLTLCSLRSGFRLDRLDPLKFSVFSESQTWLRKVTSIEQFLLLIDAAASADGNGRLGAILPAHNKEGKFHISPFPSFKRPVIAHSPLFRVFCSLLSSAKLSSHRSFTLVPFPLPAACARQSNLKLVCMHAAMSLLSLNPSSDLQQQTS